MLRGSKGVLTAECSGSATSRPAIAQPCTERDLRELFRELLRIMLSSKSIELGRLPFEIESPMRLQAAHFADRLSFTGHLTEHPAKVFRQ